MNDHENLSHVYFANNDNYYFESRVAAAKEKCQSWQEAMKLWLNAMNKAKKEENKDCAYQRAL